MAVLIWVGCWATVDVEEMIPFNVTEIDKDIVARTC